MTKKTTVKWINGLAILAFAFVILYEFVFLNMSSIFSGADKIGIILNAIALSYIAGYVIYVLSVSIPMCLKQKSSRVPVFYAISLIIDLGKQYTKKLGQTENHNFKGDFPSTEEWDEFIKKVGKKSIEVGGEDNFVRRSTEDINFHFQTIYLFSEIYYDLIPTIVCISEKLNSGVLLSTFTNPSDKNAYLNLEQVKGLLDLMKNLQEKMLKNNYYLEYEKELNR